MTVVPVLRLGVPMRAPVLRLAVAVLAIVSGLWIVWPVGEAEAVGIPVYLLHPVNDGGVVTAPPARYGNRLVGCGSDQKAVLIYNPDDTDTNPGQYAVRVGSSRVSCVSGKKNGIRVKAGQSLPWTLAGGVTYACSEDPTDAGAGGVPLGVVCAYGGPP